MAILTNIKKYTIGTPKLEKPTLKIVKTSIFCAPRGFIIFLLAAISAIDSAITGDEKRKRESLYAMYHNVVPFCEVVFLMAPLLFVLHTKVKSPVVRILAPFICMAAAFSLCMTLRILGIRKDCCSDILYNDKNPENFSFSVPKCSQTRENIPKYFWEKSEDNYGSNERNKVHAFIYKSIIFLLFVPLLVIQALDLVIRTIIDCVSYPFTKKIPQDDTKKLKEEQIPGTFSVFLTCVPFYKRTSLE